MELILHCICCHDFCLKCECESRKLNFCMMAHIRFMGIGDFHNSFEYSLTVKWSFFRFRRLIQHNDRTTKFMLIYKQGYQYRQLYPYRSWWKTNRTTPYSDPIMIIFLSGVVCMCCCKSTWSYYFVQISCWFACKVEYRLSCDAEP